MIAPLRTIDLDPGSSYDFGVKGIIASKKFGTEGSGIPSCYDGLGCIRAFYEPSLLTRHLNRW